MTTNPDRLGSSPFAKSYAPAGVLGADVDLQADGGGPCRFLRVGQAGNLALTCARGGVAVIIYAVAVGELVRVQARSIVAADTTAQKITAFW